MGFEFQFHDSDIEEDVMQVERPEEDVMQVERPEEKEIARDSQDPTIVKTARDSQDPTIVKPFHTDKFAHVASQLYPALKWQETLVKYEKLDFLMEHKQSWILKRTLDDIHYDVALMDDLSGQNELVLAFQNHSDIIAGVYEGGVKTWECSLDLMNFISVNPDLVKGKSVLELGCGSGLPGIAALLLGAAQVSFQDYNQSVIDLVTLPNLLLNTTNRPEEDFLSSVDHQDQELLIGDSPQLDKSAFYSGDWRYLSNVIPKNQQVILTSETIYNSETIPHLLQLIQDVLADDGICLVAAKQMYFGCSGNMEIFRNQALGCGFKVDEIFSNSGGVRRQIISLRK